MSNKLNHPELPMTEQVLRVLRREFMNSNRRPPEKLLISWALWNFWQEEIRLLNGIPLEEKDRVFTEPTFEGVPIIRTHGLFGVEFV